MEINILISCKMKYYSIIIKKLKNINQKLIKNFYYFLLKLAFIKFILNE